MLVGGQFPAEPHAGPDAGHSGAVPKELTELHEKLERLTNQQLVGAVKWFNVKNRYSFINCNDTYKDTFVHHTAITTKNPQKIKQNAEEGETVEFSIVEGVKGQKAVNVTGPCDRPIQGIPYATDRCACSGAAGSPCEESSFP